jgi:hypothetical protein
VKGLRCHRGCSAAASSSAWRRRRIVLRLRPYSTARSVWRAPARTRRGICLTCASVSFALAGIALTFLLGTFRGTFRRLCPRRDDGRRLDPGRGRAARRGADGAPVVAAMRIAWSLRSTMFFSMSIGLLCVLAGLTAAYYADLPPGATIVLLASASFLPASGYALVRARWRSARRRPTLAAWSLAPRAARRIAKVLASATPAAPRWPPTLAGTRCGRP